LCTLYHSSYDIDFQFSTFSQNLTVRREVPMSTVSYTESFSDPGSYPTIFYQTIMEIMGNLISGFIIGRMEEDSNGNSSGKTDVFYTPLVYSDEFTNWRVDHKISNQTIGDGKNRTFVRMVEELFKNVTLSMFSMDLLRKEVEAISNNDANATQYWDSTAYRYKPHNLLIAFSLCILFTVLGNIVGYICIHHNREAYENNLSTILRFSR
ncbi:hypothetical protein K469DRAFT_503548, partial [Zopfia rhizophila CBS 207.26]